MKLVTFLESGTPRLGAVSEGRVVDLNRSLASMYRSEGKQNAQPLADAKLPSDVIGFLGLGAEARRAAEKAVEHASYVDPQQAKFDLLVFDDGERKILPPVPRPPKIVCVARNYAEHAKEAGLELPEIPILFARFPETLVAPGDPIVRPTVSEQLDWEGELALVIGKAGGRITKEDAMSYVGGYTIFNDATIRDYQFRVTQYTAGKNFRNSGPLGPSLTLAGDVPDPHDLEIVTHVSGEEMQRANTSTMIFNIPTLIEHISEFIDLEVGDVIPTGTPAGVGFKRKPPRFLKPGDTVSISIDGIGTLENPVVDEKEPGT